MKSFREPSSPSTPDLSISLPLAIDLTISLSTIPLLALLTVGRLASQSAIQLGEASEELFRGDRLPTRPLIK